ncbi:MAG: hypothetical protein RIC16_03930 [Rhodospirillales bacterium]
MTLHKLGKLAITRFALLSVAMVWGTPSFSAETTVAELAKNTHFHGIAALPGNDAGIYLATHHGIFVVQSDGRADRVSSNRNDYMGFTPHPTDPEVLFGSGHPVGGGNMGFIMSSDGGKNWMKLADGVDGPVDFHQMDVSKADPETVIGVSGGLQLSRDGGRTWSMMGPAPEGIIDLAASGIDANRFYGATRTGLIQSKDGGETWSPAHALMRPATLVHAASGGTLYAFLVGGGLLRTEEDSLRWRLVNDGFGDAYILHLAVAPDNEDVLYAITVDPNTQAQAIIASEDGGMTWSVLGKN